MTDPAKDDLSKPSKRARRPSKADDQPRPDTPTSDSADDGEESGKSGIQSPASDLEAHPYADMFPKMEGDDFTQLVDSIQKDGLEELIITYDGKILDGRNRYAACIEAGVKPVTVNYRGDDALGYVLRMNLHRRHLTTSQRAMVAEKLATMKSGERTDLAPKGARLAIKAAAGTLKVSPRSVDRARAVRASGDDKLIKAVEQGEVTATAAAKGLVKPDKPEKTVETASVPVQQGRKLLKLWHNAEPGAQDWFLDEIGASR